MQLEFRPDKREREVTEFSNWENKTHRSCEIHQGVAEASSTLLYIHLGYKIKLINWALSGKNCAQNRAETHWFFESWGHFVFLLLKWEMLIWLTAENKTFFFLLLTGKCSTPHSGNMHYTNNTFTITPLIPRQWFGVTVGFLQPLWRFSPPAP